MLELGLLEEMPLTVVATAAGGDLPGGETRFFLDLHTEEQDLRLFFRDPEPLRLLRRAVLALLRQAKHPAIEPVLSVAYTRAPTPTTRQMQMDLLFDDELPY